jgi:hypothetical protein
MAKSKKEAATRARFPWGRLKNMWDSNRTYAEMSKALDAHYDPDGADPTKSIRAKISVAINKGINLDGKLVKFKRRSKVPVEKKSKVTTEKAKQMPTKPAATKKSKAIGKKAVTKTAATPKSSAPKKATVKKSATKKKPMPTVKVNDVANGTDATSATKQDETELLPS